MVGPLARVMAPEGVLGGRYLLGERVGAGGMATIFRAHDPVLERDVAIKVVHAHLAEDTELVERFRHEARHAASLDHPNVVHVYDAGVEDLPYIVMEYVDGPSLRQVLQRRGRLTPGQALTVVEPVAHALARAHARGVIHRDVKPENILVAGDGRAKIADFGIARTIAATSQTRTGQLVGTVHYLAPELVDGREATPASDQYALGVVLFEAVTGRKALPADSAAAVALRHARESIPAPSDFVGDVGKPFDRVVARATALDPADRFVDLTAFAHALRAAVPSGRQPVPFAAGDGQEHTLVVDRAAVPTATVDAIDDVGGRFAAQPRRPRRARQPRWARRPRWAGRARAPRRAQRSRTGRDRAGRDHAERGADSAGIRPGRGHRPGAWRRRVRARRVLRGALATVAVLGVLAAGAFAYWHLVLAPVRTVPGLVGVPEDVAELGLTLDVTGRDFDLEAPEGEILAQTPAADTTLRTGGEVDVEVSRGLDTTEVPNLVGTTVDEAQSLLDDQTLGNATVTDEVFSDTAPAGEIVSQDPGSGTSLEWTSDVGVVVSKGIEQVEVPEVVGQSQDEAQTALTDARLQVDVSSEYSDEVPTAGEVISQSVGAGDTVDKGTAVELVVSRGPLTVEMPDVRTAPIEDAVAQLEELGLDVTVAEEPVPRIGPFQRGELGRAEETLPQAGDSVQRGDGVLIYTFVDG
jgi:serine/threonine-protein kinase